MLAIRLQALWVAVGVCRVCEEDKHFIAVAERIAVRVGIKWICGSDEGVHRAQFLPISQSVAVRVGIKWVCPKDEQFLSVQQVVVVRIGVERVCPEYRFLAVPESVAVSISDECLYLCFQIRDSSL